MRTKFLFGNLKERDRFVDLGVDGRTILKWKLKYFGRAWVGFRWLRTVSSGLLFWTR